MTREVLVHSREEAVSQAARIGFPVVLKGSDPALTHKTEMGMVRVNLKNDQDVARAYDELMDKGIHMEGILVQEMVKGNREFVIGLTRSPVWTLCDVRHRGHLYGSPERRQFPGRAPYRRRRARDDL